MRSPLIRLRFVPFAAADSGLADFSSALLSDITHGGLMSKRAAALITATGLLVSVLTGLVSPAQAATPWVKVELIYYNPPGDDNNLSNNREYIRLRNTTAKPLKITGWTVRDTDGHYYKFPATTIKAKSTVTLKSGSGTNGISTRYWNLDGFVWNNSGGDKAYLRNSSGKLIHTCAYTATAVGYKKC
jgi:hypothetical protein